MLQVRSQHLHMEGRIVNKNGLLYFLDLIDTTDTTMSKNFFSAAASLYSLET